MDYEIVELAHQSMDLTVPVESFSEVILAHIDVADAAEFSPPGADERPVDSLGLALLNYTSTAQLLHEILQLVILARVGVY